MTERHEEKVARCEDEGGSIVGCSEGAKGERKEEGEKRRENGTGEKREEVIDREEGVCGGHNEIQVGCGELAQ